MKRALCVCLFIGVMAFSGSAFAEWMWAQGNVAQVQSPENCTLRYMGWGLDLESNSGMTNWVHMPVPSKAGDTWAARYFKLRFFTGSIDAWISEVHVWNGDTLVKQFTDLSYSGAYQTVQFDLGNRVAFTKGMSVSIKINAGVEPMSHRFIFDGAGAHFTQPTLP